MILAGMMRPRWNRVINSSGVQPKPRHGHRAVAIKELIVILGGGNEGILSDLIVYNTLKNHWFKPTVKGNVPPGRASFGFVVDKTRIIMFGGMMEYMECSSDVFELQASRWEWKQLRPRPPADLKPTPIQRLGHSFTLIGDKVYLFGGLTLDSDNAETERFYPRYLNDLYILDISQENMSWIFPVTYGKPPSPRESHSAVAYKDSQGNQSLVIYAGMDGRRLGDLWILRINSMTWFEVECSGQTPLPRSLHTAILVGEKMFIFGGWAPVAQSDNRATYQDKEWKVTNHLACLDLITMSWKDLTNHLPSDTPKARAGHAAVEIDRRIYMWSGRDGYRRAWNNQVCCNDLWYLDIEKPPITARPQLVKGELKSLEIQWMQTSSADCYILQIQKYEINTTSYNIEKSSLSSCFKSLQSESTIKTITHCSNISAPNESSDTSSQQTIKVDKGSISELNTIAKIPTTLPVIPLLPSQQPTIIHKIPPTETLPSLNKAPQGIALAVTRPNLPNQIRSLRPLSMSMIKVNSVNGLPELGQRFTFSKPTNLVRLGGPLTQNLKSTFIVTNPGLKLVAVNKDSQIKLVQSTKSHVVNKNPSPSEKLKPTSLLKDTLTSNCIQSIKKPKLSQSIAFSENDLQLMKSPRSSESKLPCMNAAKRPKIVTAEAENTAQPLKIPSYPEHVQIKKCKSTEGIFLSWTPPPGDSVTSYKVALVVKDNVSPLGQKVIYNGIKPECFILKSLLDSAYIDESGGTQAVKFTISAKNSLGFGPALVVKWVLHSSH